MRWTAVLFALASFPADGSSACGILWWDLGGKGQDTCLTIAEGWPLGHYVQNIPYWDPCTYDKGRCISARPTNALSWMPVKGGLPRVRQVGALSDRRVYEVMYGPTNSVLVWDRGGWAFQPALIISGDESTVARIYRPEAFRWHGTDLVHVRVLMTGTGHLQESVFLAPLNGSVVVLRPHHDETLARLQARGLRLFHRGGGFCKGSLTYLAGVKDEQGGRVGGFIAEYAIKGEAIALASMRVYLQDDPAPATTCELDPR